MWEAPSRAQFEVARGSQSKSVDKLRLANANGILWALGDAPNSTVLALSAGARNHLCSLVCESLISARFVPFCPELSQVQSAFFGR